MEGFSTLADDEIDALLLAYATVKWLKVASVIGNAMRRYEVWDEERISNRIAALVDAGKLESTGNIRKWRFSEV